jgi:LemA protein
MNKSTINIIIILAVVAILAMLIIGGYNKLVVLNEDVKAQWGNVENQYQRRGDLIPNLVATVKGYAAHESETLESVVAARSRATQVTIDPANLTPEKLQEFQNAQGQLGAALGRLIMLQENYPDLKANQNFMSLQVQLEGTENRIATERTRFNDVAALYNKSRRSFPNILLANIFGFEEKPYFAAEEGNEKAPDVEF